MKRGFFLLGWGVLLLTGCSMASHEPANLDRAKQELRAYFSSGQYDRDIAAEAARARIWIQQRAAKRAARERLAMVFDLDETLLSNWPELVADDFGGSDAVWEVWLATGNDPAIEPVRDLYRVARQLGVEVIFLTSRREHLRAATEKNLRTIGCADYAELICEPKDTKETAVTFKTAQRQRLTAEGRVIIANIGDQESDLAGGYAERTFKLPDPFYLTP
jgi:acid phosphatase